MFLSSSVMNLSQGNSKRGSNRILTILVVDDIKVNYLLIKAMTGQLHADVLIFPTESRQLITLNPESRLILF